MLQMAGGMLLIVLISGAIGFAIGYWAGKKDGIDEEAKKWKQEDEWKKKKGVSFE